MKPIETVFPVEFMHHTEGGGGYWVKSKGMSLRDHFAWQVLPSISSTSKDWDAKEIAARAYEIADAMMAERNK